MKVILIEATTKNYKVKYRKICNRHPAYKRLSIKGYCVIGRTIYLNRDIAKFNKNDIGDKKYLIVYTKFTSMILIKDKNSLYASEINKRLVFSTPADGYVVFYEDESVYFIQSEVMTKVDYEVYKDTIKFKHENKLYVFPHFWTKGLMPQVIDLDKIKYAQS